MNKVRALVRTATRTIGQITKRRVKHIYHHRYQTVHHQYNNPHLIITQSITIDPMFNNAALLVIHITSGFLTQLHLEVTIGNRFSTSLQMNKPPQQLLWKQSGFKKKTPEPSTIRIVVNIFLY